MSDDEFDETKASGATTKGKGAEPSQSLKGGTNTHFRPPKLFAISNDFELWLKRFESYVRCVGLPNEAKGDALLMSRVESQGLRDLVYHGSYTLIRVLILSLN